MKLHTLLDVSNLFMTGYVIEVSAVMKIKIFIPILLLSLANKLTQGMML